MSEIQKRNPDPFLRFRDAIDAHLGKDQGTPHRDTRMSTDFSRVTIARSAEGTYGIEHMEPIDDDGQHRIYAFVFTPDGSGWLVSGFRHCTDTTGAFKGVSQQAIEPGSFWEDMAEEMLKKYEQVPADL